MAQYPPQQYWQQGQQYVDYQQQYAQQSFGPQTPYPQQSFGPPTPYPQQPFGQSLPPQSPQPLFATPSDEVPPTIAQMGAEQQLGELRATYAPRITQPSLLVGLIMGAAVVEIILLVLFFTQHIFNKFTFWVMLLPIVLIIYAIDWYLHHKDRVYLCTYGLIYVQNQQQTPLRWDQIDEIWRRPVRHASGEITHRYEIQSANGPRIKLGNVMGGVFVHVSELGSLIEHDTMQALLPNALAAYNAGQILPFGKLSISLQGIAYGKRVYSWNEVEAVELKGNTVTLRNGTTFTRLSGVKTSDVPNFLLLQQLVANASANGAHW